MANAAVPVLPWLRVPIAVSAGGGVPLEQVQGLHARLRHALGSADAGLGYMELLPVQAVVWCELAGGHSTAHDMCIAAPTGSGKTLAYMLPIAQALAPVGGEGVRPGYSAQAPASRGLRALVVVPTRDLARQVFALACTLLQPLGLRVGLAAAQASVAEEARAVAGVLPGEGADVLVATPGRLVAHVQGTPNFSLSDLRFLVVDEADRLLRQSYQEWLAHVLAAAAPPLDRMAGLLGAGGTVAGSVGPLLPLGEHRLVKFIVSATLTQDPSKLARFQLHAPRFVAVTGTGSSRYLLPASLRQLSIITRARNKPVALLALLAQLRGRRTLVFASSVETTHRLYLLLAALPDNDVLEYSSKLSPAQRTAVLTAFRSGVAAVLISSDAMTRGMDVTDVAAVINYDAPPHPKMYIHRAGRTARAGRAGEVYTLLRDEDMRHWRALLRKLGCGKKSVEEHRLPKQLLDEQRLALKSALPLVSALLEAEAAQGRASDTGGLGKASVGMASMGKAQAPVGVPPAGQEQAVGGEYAEAAATRAHHAGGGNPIGGKRQRSCQ